MENDTIVVRNIQIQVSEIAIAKVTGISIKVEKWY